MKSDPLSRTRLPSLKFPPLCRGVSVTDLVVSNPKPVHDLTLTFPVPSVPGQSSVSGAVNKVVSPKA